MKSYTFLFLILTVFVADAFFYEKGFTNKAVWPYVKSKFPFGVRSPVSFNSEVALPINNLTPLIITTSKNDILVFNNTGYSVVLELKYHRSYNGSLTGGVLFNDVYNFISIRFLWDAYYQDKVGNVVDGISTAVTVQVIFFNKKYGDYLNALNFYDGLAIIEFPVLVLGHDPNSDYIGFQQAAKYVRHKGDAYETNDGSSVVQWINNVFNKIEVYYAFPGSYQRLSDEPDYHECATIILLPINIAPRISIDQYKTTFLQFKSSTNDPLFVILETFNAYPRPIISTSSGVKHYSK